MSLTDCDLLYPCVYMYTRQFENGMKQPVVKPGTINYYTDMVVSLITLVGSAYPFCLAAGALSSTAVSPVDVSGLTAAVLDDTAVSSSCCRSCKKSAK